MTGPGLGLADCIVDVVETGRTLQENGLAEIETVAESSARLIVNRASFHARASAASKSSMPCTRPRSENTARMAGAVK